MKDSMKMTVVYQFMYILLMQLAASAVAVVFGLVAFSYFLTINIAKEIVSLALMTMNFAMLYIYAKKFAVLDNKPYTPLKSSLLKGVLFGVFIAVLNVLMMIMLSFVWKFWGDANGAEGVIRIIVNAIFYLWTFPYGGFMNLDQGHFSIVSAIFMVIMPIAATTSGYIAGCKKFELAEKLDSLMYEKDNN